MNIVIKCCKTNVAQLVYFPSQSKVITLFSEMCIFEINRLCLYFYQKLKTKTFLFRYQHFESQYFRVF